MNIQHFVAYLNKQKGWHIEGAYYSDIIQWRDWWRGYYASFHIVKDMALKGGTCKRRMHSLRMPKRACEDWASLLLNDKTTLTVADAATARWLLGEAAGQTGGLLAQLDFWPHANDLVELAFRSGTGAFVLSCEGLRVQGGAAVASPDTHLALDYLPAECILPITIRHGRVIDAAFASEVTVEGKSCVYLQTHTLTENGYRITNEYFVSENEGTEEEGYTPAPLPKGMAAAFSTGSSVPWFSLLRPAAVKNRTGGPGLGQAVFAEAIDAAKMCDLAFDNYCRDLYLGGKKVFYSADLLKAHIGPDGTAHWDATRWIISPSSAGWGRAAIASRPAASRPPPSIPATGRTWSSTPTATRSASRRPCWASSGPCSGRGGRCWARPSTPTPPSPSTSTTATSPTARPAAPR